MQANCKNGCIYCKLGTKERRDMTLYYCSPYINNYQNRKQTVNHIYIMYMYIITVISFSIYVGRIWTGLKPTSCPDKWKDYCMIGGNRPLVETSHLSLSSWLTMWSSMNYTHFWDSVKCGSGRRIRTADKDGGWRMADGGWRTADGGQ